VGGRVAGALSRAQATGQLDDRRVAETVSGVDVSATFGRLIYPIAATAA
jgi:hypothetical protein